MPIRSVTRELEAKLKPVAGGPFRKPSGKLESKTYGDGTERLKITLRGLGAQDGAQAVVTAAGVELARLPVARGAARFDTETKDAGAFPPLEPGQAVEVHVDGALQLTGTLAVD